MGSMECDCECSCLVEDGELIDPCTWKMVKARKKWKCFECDRVIKPGEEYELLKGKCDGEWVTQRTCLGCMRLRNSMDCCSGVLAEEVKHCFGVDILVKHAK